MEIPGTKLFVGNISERVETQDLRADFEKYGRVHEVKICQGYGFVTFEDPRCAYNAVEVGKVLLTEIYERWYYFSQRIWTGKVMLVKGWESNFPEEGEEVEEIWRGEEWDTIEAVEEGSTVEEVEGGEIIDPQTAEVEEMEEAKEEGVGVEEGHPTEATE